MKVSVICTNYNKGDWVREALDSILMQKLDWEFEILVIDDASNDHSPRIIKEYQQKYPDKIRAFFNHENQGITKTWKSICLEAKGDYIARCDGDDYWIDKYKLKKQINAMQINPNSHWCITDFDIVTANGEVTTKAAIRHQAIRKMASFEEELAYKGMTMSSTWLVERGLLLAANESLPDEAVDDTFNLQLELFQKTSLTFLEDSTTVYRLGQESDSHPEALEKMQERYDRLKETQLYYLTHSEKIDLMKVSRYLIDEVAEQEKMNYGLQLSKKMTEDYLAIIENEKNSLASYKIETEQLIHSLERQLTSIEEDRDMWMTQYNTVINSRRWIIPTKIINLFRRNK